MLLYNLVYPTPHLQQCTCASIYYIAYTFVACCKYACGAVCMLWCAHYVCYMIGNSCSTVFSFLHSEKKNCFFDTAQHVESATEALRSTRLLDGKRLRVERAKVNRTLFIAKLSRNLTNSVCIFSGRGVRGFWVGQF